MVQEAKYEVVENLGRIEVRHYAPMVVARVNGAGDGGFGNLFRYISGNNRQRSKLAMTAPVIAQRGGPAAHDDSERIAMTAPVISDMGSIAFVMPDGYRLETTPEPLDEAVTVEEVPGRHVAVLRFSGRWTTSAFKRRSEELLAELERAGVVASGDVFSMRYNPPFTPWFMRRNEVGVEIDLTE
jgi:hypothetical protein